MPRFTDAELQDLKRDLDLVALVRAKGVDLKPHGKDLIGLCPFHNDVNPSLVVTPGKNLWHCLGACQEGGDVIKWVQRAEGVSFRHAVELLRDGHASRIITSARVTRQSTVSRLPAPVELSVDDQTLLQQVIHYTTTIAQSLCLLSGQSPEIRRSERAWKRHGRRPDADSSSAISGLACGCTCGGFF